MPDMTPTRGQLLFRYAHWQGHKPGLEIVKFISQSLAGEGCTQETWEVKEVRNTTDRLPRTIRCPIGFYFRTKVEALQVTCARPGRQYDRTVRGSKKCVRATENSRGTSKNSKRQSPRRRRINDLPKAVIAAEGETMIYKLLTAEQKAAYLKDSGKCPHCGSGSIEGGEVECEGDRHYQSINCTDCGYTWTDVYKLAEPEDEAQMCPLCTTFIQEGEEIVFVEGEFQHTVCPARPAES